MDFEHLGETWRNRSADVSSDSTSLLISRIRQRALELETIVKRRDRIETWSALIVFPVFTWVSVVGRFTVSRIGSGILAAACLFIPIWLLLARRPAPDPSLPLCTALAMERARVEGQVRLLKNVVWWYLLPLGLGVVLFLAGPWSSPWQLTAIILSVGALYGWIYRLNMRAVRLELLPRLQELDQAIASFQNET